MEINKTASPNGIQANNNTKQVQDSVSVENISKKDTVEFSDQGKMQVLYKKAMDILRSTPDSTDIRLDKVKEAQKFLATFKTTPSDEILADISLKLLKDFGLS